jgi:ribonuclease HII
MLKHNVRLQPGMSSGMFVLGTDEAGYGPNLGPLCVAASAWEVPDGFAAEGMYRRLAACVTQKAEATNGKLAIADSKQLFKAGGPLGCLERGVLAALAAVDRLPKCWRDCWRALDGEALAQIDSEPWSADFNESLPLETTAELLLSGREAVTCGCAKRDVRILELQAAVLFPAAFNEAVSRLGNKAEVLSLTTLRLAKRILEALPPGRAIVVCDKHGGRNFYAALLQHVFPEELVVVRHESALLSVYEVRHGGRLAEFRFQPKGERHLPTALASMTAKYLRELAMRPFNAFWQRHVQDLRPTAGYNSDAKRFYEEIRAAKERLAVADTMVWRAR